MIGRLRALASLALFLPAIGVLAVAEAAFELLLAAVRALAAVLIRGGHALAGGHTLLDG